MNFSADSGANSGELDINITPLIDVVFLLLTFFMVSTTFDTSSGIKVNLPKATTAPSEKSSEQLTVTIDGQGLIYLNDRPVKAGDLAGEVARVVKEKSPAGLILKADTKVEHGIVVRVMDQAKAAGIEKIAIATSPPG